MPEFCHNYSVPLYAFSGSEKKALVTRARCKLWSCPYCARVNQKVWSARIMLQVGLDETKEWTFFTFTLLGKHHKSSVSSLHYWRGSWDKLMKRLKRQFGKFNYVRVFETHKTGAFHVHMLADTAVADVKLVTRPDGSQYWHSDTVKRHLDALKLGYIHDCKPLREDGREHSSKSALIASYVAKYLTKDVQTAVRSSLKTAGMGKIRMIQPSRGWAQVPSKTSDLAWAVGPLPLDEAAAVWRHEWIILDVNRQLTITSHDYYEYTHYPNRVSDLEMLIDDN